MKVRDQLVACAWLGGCAGEPPTLDPPPSALASAPRVETSASPSALTSSLASATARSSAVVETAEVLPRQAPTDRPPCPPVPPCKQQTELRCLGSIAMQALTGPSCDERCVPFDWPRARHATEESATTNPFLACNGDLPLFCSDPGECGAKSTCILDSRSSQCVPVSDTERTSGFELCGRGNCRLGGVCETHPGGLRVCKK